MKKRLLVLVLGMVVCLLFFAILQYSQEVQSSDLPGTATIASVVGAAPWISFVFSGPGDVYTIDFSTVDPADLEIGTQDCCILDDIVQIYLDECLLGEHRSVDGIKYAYHTVSLPPGNHTLRLVNTSSAVSASGWLYRLNYSAYTGDYPYCATLADLEITKLDFRGSQYPYDPDQLSFIAYVRNKGTAGAQNVEVKFFVSGQEVDSAYFAYLPSGAEMQARIYYTFPERLNENVLIEARAGIPGEDDLNPEDNLVSKFVGFYWVSNDGGQSGFLHDRDSFSFPNWSWENIYLELLTALGPIADGGLLDGLVTAIQSAVTASLGLGGHCTGMAYASGSYFISPETKPFSQERTTYEVGLADVFADILERHSWGVISVLPGILDAWDEHIIPDASAEYFEVLSQVRDMNKPVILELFSADIMDLPKNERADHTPHTVLCYKILDLGEEGKKLFVYDNIYEMSDSDSNSLNDKDDDYFVMLNAGSYQPSYRLYNRFFATPVRTEFGSQEKNAMIDSLLGSAVRYGIHHLTPQIFQTHSPVQTLIVDQYGRRIGFDNGQEVNEIPGAVIVDGLASEYFMLPGSLSFRAEMNGIADGTLGIDSLSIEDSKIKIVKFRDIEVHPGLLVTAEIDPGLNEYHVESGSAVSIKPALIGILGPGDIDGPLSVDTLINCVNFYYEVGWIKNVGVKDGLLRKLNTIQNYLTNHRIGASINQLLAFSDQVNNARNVEKVAKEYLESLTKLMITRLGRLK